MHAAIFGFNRQLTIHRRRLIRSSRDGGEFSFWTSRAVDGAVERGVDRDGDGDAVAGRLDGIRASPWSLDTAILGLSYGPY